MVAHVCQALPAAGSFDGKSAGGGLEDWASACCPSQKEGPDNKKGDMARSFERFLV